MKNMRIKLAMVLIPLGLIIAAVPENTTKPDKLTASQMLQGGLNYWAETIMNPQKPSSTSPDDEIAKYDFRKGASAALGGGVLQTSSSTKTSGPKPPIKKRKKKKRAAGGC